MGNEPKPVISLSDAVNFVGWLTLLGGALVLVFSCNRFNFGLCSSALMARAALAMGAGSTIIIGRWVAWGDREDLTGQSSVWSRLGKVGFAILVTILFILFLALGPFFAP